MTLSNQKKSDEIDLFQILLKTVIIVKSNLIKLILLFLLGVAIGLGYFFISKKLYHNRMIISSTILTTSYTRVLFENASRLLSEGSTATLASQFKVSEDVIRKLNSLSLESLNKSPGEELRDSERFMITVEVTDQSVIPELQKGLITYLENNEFVKIRVEQSKYFHRQMLIGLEKEIKDLEDFKERISNGSFFQTTRGNVMFDPTTVNSKILELAERKIQLENGLALSNSVQVIEGFTPFIKESKPKLTVSIVGGVLLGFILIGVFFALKGLQRLLDLADQKETT